MSAQLRLFTFSGSVRRLRLRLRLRGGEGREESLKPSSPYRTLSAFFSRSDLLIPTSPTPPFPLPSCPNRLNPRLTRDPVRLNLRLNLRLNPESALQAPTYRGQCWCRHCLGWCSEGRGRRILWGSAS